jgi:hypothetical protein
MDRGFDPYHKWLGIPAVERPAHFYRLLGVGLFEGDAEAVSAAADARIAQLRGYLAGPHAAEAQQLLAEIVQARGVLLHPAQRAAYDAALRQHFAAMQAQAMPMPAAANPMAAHGYGSTAHAGPGYLAPANAAAGYSASGYAASQSAGGPAIPLAAGGRASAYGMPMSVVPIAASPVAASAAASIVRQTPAEPATAMREPATATTAVISQTEATVPQGNRSATFTKPAASDGMVRPRPQLIAEPSTANGNTQADGGQRLTDGERLEGGHCNDDDSDESDNPSGKPDASRGRTTADSLARRGMPVIGIGLGGLTGLVIGYGLLVAMRSDLDFLHLFSSPPPVVEKKKVKRHPLAPLPDEPVELAQPPHEEAAPGGPTASESPPAAITERGKPPKESKSRTEKTPRIISKVAPIGRPSSQAATPRSAPKILMPGDVLEPLDPADPSDANRGDAMNCDESKGDANNNEPDDDTPSELK